MILTIILAVVFYVLFMLFVYSMFKAAAEEDARIEEMYRKFKALNHMDDLDL